VVAIGSLHHTGDLEKALKKVEQLIKPGGATLIMVYNVFQLRRILLHPFRTIKEFYHSSRFSKESKFIFEELDMKIRGKADSNREGDAAPYTAFASRKLFNQRLDMKYKVELQNFHRIPIISRFISRDFLMRHLSKYLGCDIYALGKKIIKIL
jgi:hypothetical protein